MDTVIISITGSKGGIGKTTAAVSISDALVRFNQMKVLLVETDGQASSSFHLGLRGKTAESKGIVPKMGLANILRGEPLSESITKIKDGFGFLAGGPDAQSTIEEHAAHGLNNSGVKLFRDVVLKSEFDVCIIDAPPGINKSTAFTWMSSDYVILPYRPKDVESIEALRTIMSHLKAARKETGFGPSLMGLIGSDVDRRTKMGRDIPPKLKEVYSPKNQYLGHCPSDVNMSNAVLARKTIFDFAPASRGALHYKEIASEVCARIKQAQRNTK